MHAEARRRCASRSRARQAGCAVRCMIPRIWAAVRSGCTASISPTTPATYGLAMLVPVIADPRSSAPANPLAATMSVPGAATSGLERPSRVGPWLLEMLMRSRVSSRLATEMTRWPQASELTESRRRWSLGEERREAPSLLRPDAADLLRIVALDPAVEAPVAHFERREAHRPRPGRTPMTAFARERAQVDRRCSWRRSRGGRARCRR